jgi:hypothetical protein
MPGAGAGAGAGAMRAGFPLLPPTAYNTAALFGAMHAPPISTPPPADAIAAVAAGNGSGSGSGGVAQSLVQWQATQQQIYQLWFENQTILLQHHM